MSIKHFLFRDVAVEHAKVSHGPFVGLPSLTGLTGLAAAFSLRLAQALGLQPHELQAKGVLMALGRYHRHEGYKKAQKRGKPLESEAVPAVWASFSAHLVFRVCGVTGRAKELLAAADLRKTSEDVLDGLSLCKGTLQAAGTFVNLDAQRLRNRYPTEAERALAMIPSTALVIREQSDLVELMRQQGLALMEGLIAATLRHANRPQPYRAFFEQWSADDELQVERWKLAPVLNGYLYLEDEPSLQSERVDANGLLGPSRAASAVYTLTRLQTAASLRVGAHAGEPLCAFWEDQAVAAGRVCVTTEEALT